jgi:translation initiation factor IF-2
VHGLGTTIDVALINGSLSIGDKIILPGQEGPIVTQVRRILLPELNQDIRVTVNHLDQRLSHGFQRKLDLDSI